MNNLEIKVKYIPGITRYFSSIEDIFSYGFSHPKVKPGMLKLIELLTPYVAIFSYYTTSEIVYQHIVNAQRNHHDGTMSEYARLVLLMRDALTEHFVQGHALVLDLTA